MPSLLTLSNIFHKQFFYFASSFCLKTNLIKNDNKCQDNCVSIAKRPINKFLDYKTVTMGNILTIPIRFVKPFLNEKGYVIFIQLITVILFHSAQEQRYDGICFLYVWMSFQLWHQQLEDLENFSFADYLVGFQVQKILQWRKYIFVQKRFLFYQYYYDLEINNVHSLLNIDRQLGCKGTSDESWQNLFHIQWIFILTFRMFDL